VTEDCLYTVSAGPWDPRGVSSTPNLLRGFTRDVAPVTIPAGITPFRTEEMLSPDSFWRKPLAADVPLLADRRWARNLCAQMDLDPDTPATATHPALLPGALPGNAWFNKDAGGSPLYVVGPNQPTQRVRLIPPGTASDGDLQASWEAVPVPDVVTPGNSGDKSVCIWQPSTDTMWEFWVWEGTPGAYTAKWGGTMREASQNIGVYQNQPAAFGSRWQWSNWGHTASSLPINAGAIQPEEIDRGFIGHALHMVAGWTAREFVWPAQRCDGPGKWYLRADGTWGTWRSGAQFLTYPDMVPEGCRLRFPADLDLAPYTGVTRMLVEAVRDYGLVITDQTGVGCGIRFRESTTYTAAGQPNPWTSRMPKWPHEYMWAMPWHRLEVIDPAVR
jgi:hypothetical protein